MPMELTTLKNVPAPSEDEAMPAVAPSAGELVVSDGAPGLLVRAEGLSFVAECTKCGRTAGREVTKKRAYRVSHECPQSRPGRSSKITVSRPGRGGWSVQESA